jgi:CHAT domain-containing protein
LLRAQGLYELALGAYQAAVDHVEAIRQDIPIEYVGGRSSFRETLEPIYIGLAELLLQRADNAKGGERLQLFRRARDAVELIKQTELQDYLGERCLVTSLAPGSASQLSTRTAVLYPVILPNRLALLVETQTGIEAVYANIDSDVIRAKATSFARDVRETMPGYLALAQELYDLLIRPIEPTLAEQKIDTLVFVPDGPLRLVPVGALHDGRRFLIEKFAVAIAPGLSVIGSARQERGIGKVLLAGLSEPGPVVGKLSQRAREQLGLGSVTRGTRAPDLAEGLALPGVAEEIRALKSITHGDRLLNSEFTVERFRQQFDTEEYRTVHIASHAVFSQRFEGSFILAYDDLLTMDQLQTLLRGRTLEDSPISLLTLSACQTAEGDDRVPLGIAGAALKAHAGSALGSLWAVDDVATKTLMVGFYESMAKGEVTKAKALQQAQLALLKNKSMDHPFFWAPFILVGSGQ